MTLFIPFGVLLNSASCFIFHYDSLSNDAALIPSIAGLAVSCILLLLMPFIYKYIKNKRQQRSIKVTQGNVEATVAKAQVLTGWSRVKASAKGPAVLKHSYVSQLWKFDYYSENPITAIEEYRKPARKIPYSPIPGLFAA